jgi:hypothetical protein
MPNKRNKIMQTHKILILLLGITTGSINTFAKEPHYFPYLYWHWSPRHAWHIDHRLIGWNETLITYFLGIASSSHGIDPGMYYSGWASQDTIARDYRVNWGKTAEGLKTN